MSEGAYGEVYYATHRMLARPAAIKLIRPEVFGGNDQAAAQLAEERVNHHVADKMDLLPCYALTQQIFIPVYGGSEKQVGDLVSD